MTESLTAKIPRMHSPVNRLAARVIQSGIQYEETFVAKSEIVSEVPLPTRAYPSCERPEDNLTGQKFGRFTVIGRAATSASWVVRCACGRYCYRKAKVLKTVELQAASQVMCPRCSNVAGGSRANRPDAISKNLRGAALPMYAALKDILANGLTTHTRANARYAMGIALGEPERNEAREVEIKHIFMRDFREVGDDPGATIRDGAISDQPKG